MMNSLENLIKAAEDRGAAERLSHAGERTFGERALGELGSELASQAVQMDESGAFEAMQETGRAIKTAKAVVDLAR